MSRRTRIAVFSVLVMIGVALAVVVAAAVIAQTGWFRNKVREKIVSVAEKATGGRVEIGAFNYRWSAMTAEAGPFVLHGKEPPSDPPFFRAEKIQIGLKIISILEKQVDIASLTMEKPQVYVTVAPDGSTNIPNPRVQRRSDKNFAEQLLDLKVNHFELHDGFAEYNSQRIPIDVTGDRLQASFVYETAGPRYVGAVSARQVRLSSPRMKGPLSLDLDTRIVLERNAIQVLPTRLASQGSKIELQGSILDIRAPRGSFEVKASMPVKELNNAFGLPLESRGQVSFQGKGSVESSPFRYQLEGRLTASELAYVYKNLAIRKIGIASRVEMTPARINLPDLELSALGGRFRGSAQVQDFKRLAVQGAARGFSLKEVAQLGERDTGQLSGTMSGTAALEGSFTRAGVTDIKAEARLDIVPGTGGVPVQGAIAINYDQRAGRIQLGNSDVNLGSTHVSVSGTLGATLNVHVATGDLNDFLPLFPLFGETPPEQLPVALHGGVARFDGTVTGPLADPRISGKAEVGHLVLDRREFDHFTGSFDIVRSGANLNTLVLEQGKMRLEGQGRAGLTDWKLEDASPISLLLSVRGADIGKLLADNGTEAPVSGTLSATVQVTGTFESPLISANVDAENITAYDEHFDRARADITMTASALEVTNAELRSGSARITGRGSYNHPSNDWNDGSLRFDVASERLSLTQINHVQQFRKGLAGEGDVKAGGTAKVVKGVLSLASLNGQLSLKNVVVDGRPYGNIEVIANTRLPVLTLGAKVNFRGIQLQGSGEWRMEGDYLGQAHIQVPRVTFATLHDLWPGEHQRKELPFDGFIEGDVTISGPMSNPGAMRASVTLATVQLSAGPNVRPVAGTRTQDLVLKNAQPVVFEGSTKSIEIRSASFVAKDTTLDASGRLALDSKNPWDLSVKGRIHLSILQIFNPDLLASGTSVVNVAVRGPLSEPQVEGRLELQNASLFIRDLPNGVDQANGLILFDRNRATVQNLTAVTGGGNVTFQSGSFVGFRGSALVYRLQATARQVRYRSPDGISVTVDATLNLAGTSESSLLSGDVTVVRAGFNPRTDVGTLLAETARPIAAPETPNEYLRGIQFDVHVLSSGSLEVETSLTRNIQAEADLHLRGTPDRPAVLGSVSVNSGEIEFFGNKYSINRGEVNFYNPTRIEPVIDMDLETHVRGIVVDISFSGSLNKLNFSYRSDPPLETNQIISLLAVGRTPPTLGGLASTQTLGSTNYLATGSNALLGQAIAPASGRLQRFFGVSHIKIDPQLTDITAIPQARLTLEQQISPDITLTYITNLARTDQQIVRVEWDFSKKWSVVALRDENGAFGIDFQYRKRFK